MTQAFVDYFKCPSDAARLGIKGPLSSDAGYFRFRNAVGYGRVVGGRHTSDALVDLPDTSQDVDVEGGQVRLPFDLSQVVTNLREERYPQASRSVLANVTRADTLRELYYFFRPILPVQIRKHLQRIHLRGWREIPFPQWPVDLSVDTLMRHAMELSLRTRGLGRIPFVWFWPNGASSAVMVTHDVEDRAGRDFSAQLADLDDSFGIKSAFQLVPEERGDTSKGFRDLLRGRGFEINVHDLNHDGLLFQNRSRFEDRAARINRYVNEFECRGFRAGAMYRELEWLGALDVSFDMSVPNVAHLEPQRGGCCTVMPFFVGTILELPLTTIQDYSLFHILGDYSIALWKRQMDMILAMNGLVSILTHPDYLIERRARAVYGDLLSHVTKLRDEKGIWVALPGEVDAWWRARQEMRLVPDGQGWRIEGTGSERARVAYATLEDDRLVFKMDAGQEDSTLSATA